MPGYERKEVYPTDHIFSDLDSEYRVFDGDEIAMGSARYQVFHQSCHCVTCGIEGTFFAKERTGKTGRYHFNLYAVRDDGSEVLMTKDHIIPRAKGGPDTLSNYQTMCESCNSKKGNFYVDETLLNRMATVIRCTPNVWIDQQDGVVKFCRYGTVGTGEPKVVVLETHLDLESENDINNAHLQCVNKQRALIAFQLLHKLGMLTSPKLPDSSPTLRKRRKKRRSPIADQKTLETQGS